MTNEAPDNYSLKNKTDPRSYVLANAFKNQTGKNFHSPRAALPHQHGQFAMNKHGNKRQRWHIAKQLLCWRLNMTPVQIFLTLLQWPY